MRAAPAGAWPPARLVARILPRVDIAFALLMALRPSSLSRSVRVAEEGKSSVNPTMGPGTF